MSEERSKNASKTSVQSVGTITYRTFLVFLLGIAMGVATGVYIGIQQAERAQSNVAVVVQKNFMEAQGEIYSNLPRTNEQSIKWLRNKTR